MWDFSEHFFTGVILNVEMGNMRPPFGIQAFNPLSGTLTKYYCISIFWGLRLHWHIVPPCLWIILKHFKDLYWQLSQVFILLWYRGWSISKLGSLLQTGYMGLLFYCHRAPRITWFSWNYLFICDTSTPFKN